MSLDRYTFDTQLNSDYASPNYKLEFLTITNFKNETQVRIIEKLIKKYGFDSIVQIGDPDRVYDRPLIRMVRNNIYFMPLKKLVKLNFRSSKVYEIPGILLEENFGDCLEPKRSDELIEKFGGTLVSVLDKCDCDTHKQRKVEDGVCVISGPIVLKDKKDSYRYLHLREIRGSILVKAQNAEFYFPRLETIRCLNPDQPAVTLSNTSNIKKSSIHLPSLKLVIGCKSEIFIQKKDVNEPVNVAGVYPEYMDQLNNYNLKNKRPGRLCDKKSHSYVLERCEFFLGDLDLDLTADVSVYRNIRKVVGRIVVVQNIQIWDFSMFEKLESIECTNKQSFDSAAILFSRGTEGFKQFNFPRLSSLIGCYNIYKVENDWSEATIIKEVDEKIRSRELQRKVRNRASTTQYYGDLVIDAFVSEQTQAKISRIREIIGGSLIFKSSAIKLKPFRFLSGIRYISCKNIETAPVLNYMGEYHDLENLDTFLDCDPKLVDYEFNQENTLNYIDPDVLNYLNPFHQPIRICDELTTDRRALQKCTRFIGILEFNGRDETKWALSKYRNVREVYGSIVVRFAQLFDSKVLSNVKTIICGFPEERKFNITSALVVEMAKELFLRTTDLTKRIRITNCGLLGVFLDGGVILQSDVYATAIMNSRVPRKDCVIPKYNIGMEKWREITRGCETIRGDLVIDGKIDDVIQLTYQFRHVNQVFGNVIIQNVQEPWITVLEKIDVITGSLQVHNSPKLYRMDMRALKIGSGIRVQNTFHLCIYLESYAKMMHMPRWKLDSDCPIELANWTSLFAELKHVKEKYGKSKVGTTVLSVPRVAFFLLLLLCSFEVGKDIIYVAVNYFPFLKRFKKEKDRDDNDESDEEDEDGNNNMIIEKYMKKKGMDVDVKRVAYRAGKK